jgi:Putative lumazine-binding
MASETGSATEVDQITAVVRDYVDGYFDGDAERMRRALHPGLVKRCRGIEGDDPDALETLSAQDMIDLTADGEGSGMNLADRQVEIEITYLGGEIASVTCTCAVMVDLLHLIRMPEGWRIVNAAWRLA